MAGTYEVKIEGIDKLIAKLTAATRSELLLKAMSDAAWEMARWSKEFRFIGRGAGGKVKYGKIAKAFSVHPTILTSRTGILRGSITAKSEKTGDNVYIGKFGTNVKYGPTHEFGDSRRNIPPRPFLSPAIKNADNIKKVEGIIMEVIKAGLEKQ